MTKRLEISFEHSLEEKPAVRKSFFESLPYFLGHPYDVSVVDGGVTVEGVPEPQHQKVSAALIDAYQRIESEHERSTEQSLHRFDGEYTTQDGIYEDFVRRGWLQPTGFGKTTYSGALAQVFLALDKLILSLCEKHGARQELYPLALEGKSLHRAGYFNTFAQHAYFISPLRTTLDALESAKNGAVIDPCQNTNDHLQNPDWVLSPTVCHHCFETRKDHALELPFKVTALNQCARYEVHGTRSLERLRLYWMREFIHFDADEKLIAASLDAVLDDTVKLLTRWGITHEVVSASDPFFSNSGTAKRMFQNTFILKRELKLPLANSSIACASFNNHQESLTKSFGITSADSDSTIGSCCVGWGYDRLLLGLFSQLGTDLEQWPSTVRQDLEI